MGTGVLISESWYYPVHLTPITPGSVEYPQLLNLLTRAEVMIEQLMPANSFQGHVVALARAAMQETLQARRAAITAAVPTISWLFLLLLMFWLGVIFIVFGLISPRNGLTHAVIVLSAISISSSVYLILDLDTPFRGFISVSSQPLRDALQHVDQQ